MLIVGQRWVELKGLSRRQGDTFEVIALDSRGEGRLRCIVKALEPRDRSSWDVGAEVTHRWFALESFTNTWRLLDYW